MATGCFKYKIAYLSLFGSRIEFLLLKGKTISFNFEKQLLHRSLIVRKPASCKTHCLVLSIRRVRPKSRDPKLCLDFKSMHKAIKSFVISHSIANASSKKKMHLSFASLKKLVIWPHNVFSNVSHVRSTSSKYSLWSEEESIRRVILNCNTGHKKDLAF